MSERKLGRKRSRFDRRTLWFSRYIKAVELPAPPLERDWTKAMDDPWGMMLNDSIGDCVLAAAGHMIQGWTHNAGKGFNPPDASILKAYQDVGQYDPKDPSSDQGAEPLAALKYWRNTGIAGHKIGAFVALNPKRPEQFVHAVNLFGTAYIALGLPIAAQNLDIWDIPNYQEPVGDWALWSWGGHMVEAPKYDVGGIPVVTWGVIQPMSWDFLGTYCDEAYAVLSEDMLNDAGFSTLGFDIDTLRKDLAEVTQA